MLIQTKAIGLLLLTALLLSTSSAKCQTHLQLILNTNIPVDSVFVVHWTDQEKSWLPFKDTLDINFKTRGINFYHLNYVAKDQIYFAPLFLDTGHIKIISHLDNGKLVIDTVTGSPMYKRYTQWKSDFNKLKLDKDTALLDSFLLETYEANSDNLFSFHIGNRYLDMHQNDKFKLYALLPLLAKQSNATKEQFGFSILNDRLQGILKNDVIKLADHPLINLHNKTIRVKTRKAQMLLLDFWFVGCLPCLEDHQKMHNYFSLLDQYQTKLISISNDDSYKKWKNYLDKHAYPWAHYKKFTGKNNIVSQLGVSTYPTYILLDQTGRIVFSTYSLTEMMSQLKHFAKG